MITLIIFGAALMCLLFFVLGSILKFLASVFNGLLTSGYLLIIIFFLAGITSVALFLVYMIVDGFLTGIIVELLGSLIGLVIIVGFMLTIITGIAAPIISIALMLLETVLNITSAVLENGSRVCEKIFIYFLTQIYKRIDRC